MRNLCQANRCRNVAPQGLHTLINCIQHVLNLAQYDDNKLLLTNSNGTYVMRVSMSACLNHHGQVSSMLNFSRLNQIASVTLVLCALWERSTAEHCLIHAETVSLFPRLQPSSAKFSLY